MGIVGDGFLPARGRAESVPNQFTLSVYIWWFYWKKAHYWFHELRTVLFITKCHKRPGLQPLLSIGPPPSTSSMDRPSTPTSITKSQASLPTSVNPLSPRRFQASHRSHQPLCLPASPHHWQRSTRRQIRRALVSARRTSTITQPYPSRITK